MAKNPQPGRLVKDPSTLEEFWNESFRGEIRRRILMVVGNRLVGDSRVLKSATSLALDGFEVVLVGARPMADAYACGHLDGIPFLMVNSEELALGADAEGHETAIRAIGERLARGIGASVRFGVLYTHDFWGLGYGFHVMQATAYRQTVLWLHDVHEYIRGYEGILPAGRLQYAIEAETRLIGLPDQLMFVNERIADLVCREHDLSPPQRLVVHNAPRRQRPSKFQLRDKLGLGPNVPLGLYLGRATKARGLDVLVPALKAIPELHFALLSSAANDYLNELRALATKAGVQGRLHIFPYVADEEVASAASTATFGISPLTRYGNADLAVPTKVLEFLHAQLPMIVSDATFQADFVREHALGEVYAASSSEEFTAAVRKLISGSYTPDWERLRSQYSWQSQYQPVLDMLEDYCESDSIPMRGIFHGPGASAGQPGILSAALRRAGRKAQSVNLSASAGLSHKSDARWPAPNLIAQASLAMWAARRFDLFHMHFRPFINMFGEAGYDAASFSDLPLLREGGKRLVFQFRGSEIRINSEFRKFNPFAWAGEDDPSGMRDDLRLVLRDVVREAADVILVPDPELRTYVPEARILQRAVDLDQLRYVGPKRSSRPLVCHAPSRRGAKGTDHVLAAVQALQDQGISFDFKLLEGVPHEQLMQQLAEADIVIDQILIGWYGVLSVEAMALGKAVIAYIRDDLVNELPPGILENANPKTLEAKLRRLIEDADLRRNMGETARAFVQSYHAPEVVARQLQQIYDELDTSAYRAPSPRLFRTRIDTAHAAVVLEKKLQAARKAAQEAGKGVPADTTATPKDSGKGIATPAKAGTSTKPSPKGKRSLADRIAHASLAKVANRIRRMLRGE